MIQWCDTWASLNHLKPFPKGTWMMLKVGTLLQHQKWAVGNKDCVRLGMWMVGRAAIVPTSFGSVHAQLNQWTWWSRVLAIICIRAPLNMGSPQIQCGVSSFSQLKIWSVVDLPLWKIWKSVGMIIPYIWKNKSHVRNHQFQNYIFLVHLIVRMNWHLDLPAGHGLLGIPEN